MARNVNLSPISVIFSQTRRQTNNQRAACSVQGLSIAGCRLSIEKRGGELLIAVSEAGSSLCSVCRFRIADLTRRLEIKIGARKKRVLNTLSPYW